jgi:hypothetical protein
VAILLGNGRKAEALTLSCIPKINKRRKDTLCSEAQKRTVILD